MKKYKVLIIGVGSIGERHLRCFQATGRVDVALCELNAQLRETVAQRYGVTQAFGDLNQALADKPDAAVICVPAHLHISMARQLTAQGVHILVEKPLSTTLDGAEELIAEVEQAGTVAAVAYVSRQWPAVNAMRDALVKGRFGKPVHVIVASGQNFPTFRPAYREIYYANRAAGGGAIQDALTHMVNLAEYLVGPVTQLVADASHQVLDGVTVEDTVNVVARHGSALASYSLNQHQAPNETTVTVVCEKGTLRWEAHNQRWLCMEKPGDPWTVSDADAMERDGTFTLQANSFIDAIEGKAPVKCTLQEGLQTLRVNLAILASSDDTPWRAIESASPARS